MKANNYQAKNQNNIINHREYNIKNENIDYILRIEINQQYIYFILSKLNEPLEYNYKNTMDLSSIINKLELNPSKYSNLDSILKIIDNINKKNKILININEDNSCNLIFKLINALDEEFISEIKLYKEYMNINDKFNILYNKINLIKNINNKNEENEEIEKMKNKIKELNIYTKKREEEIKDILKQKNIIIKNINEKLLNQEKIIKEIENKLINNFDERFNTIKNHLMNEINKQNEKIEKLKNNKDEDKIEILFEKNNILINSIDSIKKEIKNINEENKIKNEEYNNTFLNQNKEINNSNKKFELIKEEIKEMNNKININEKDIKKIENITKEKEIIINNINEKIDKQINIKSQNNNNIELVEEINNNNENKEKNNEINKIIENDNNNKLKEVIKDIKLNDKFNEKINELNEDNNYNKLNKIDKLYNEYINKINYEFKKEPTYLKFKLNITNNNTKFGWNDKFEIFISYKDNKEYLISPNKNNYNLDIFRLLDNDIIISLKGHNYIIRTIRYFINKKNYNEYLISGDDDKIVIIWDITNNYNIKYQIDTNYGGSIYSCLLIFPNNIDDNYIITSTFSKSYNNEKSATKIYSLNNGKFIKYINNTSNYHIYYLLSWYNKMNNKYYIIQFLNCKIIINNLVEDELYSELKQKPEDNHYSGFIYNKDDNDYLCTSSCNGYINIWDLYNKKIFKIINTNNCKLSHIIQWNNKYIIVADANNKSFKIIDLEDNKISDIGGQHKNYVKSIKKINHPLYGESLLSAGDDNIIKLWTIN